MSRPISKAALSPTPMCKRQFARCASRNYHNGQLMIIQWQREIAYSIIILSAFSGLSTLIEEEGVALATEASRFIGIDMDIDEVEGCSLSRFIGIGIGIDEVAGCSMSFFIGIDIDVGIEVVAGLCIPCDPC